MADATQETSGHALSPPQSTRCGRTFPARVAEPRRAENTNLVEPVAVAGTTIVELYVAASGKVTYRTSCCAALLRRGPSASKAARLTMREPGPRGTAVGWRSPAGAAISGRPRADFHVALGGL
ncbi:hypothetical protein BV133_1442 [Blastochloris viridis]|uniref:Uncharacterized protein n=1 Tax=Blastochloris viridis TaxID=1079 RepID=A0A182D0S9_BLAVI|nr:hypothetical protein BV133_1442 [Blastochloris viridis]